MYILEGLPANRKPGLYSDKQNYQYEEMTYGKPWFKNIVVCAGDTFPHDSGMINEGEYATREVVDVMSNFSSEKLWASKEI